MVSTFTSELSALSSEGGWVFWGLVVLAFGIAFALVSLWRALRFAEAPLLDSRDWRRLLASPDPPRGLLDRLSQSLPKQEPDRVIEEIGPFAISSVHYVYDKLKENGGEPPPHMRPFWKEYCALVEQVPASHRHMRVHAGHCTYMLPEEVPFVTPDLLRATCLVGTADEVASAALYLASDEAAYVTGQTLHVNGGMAMP